MQLYSLGINKFHDVQYCIIFRRDNTKELVAIELIVQPGEDEREGMKKRGTRTHANGRIREYTA